jgi:2-aminoadipate transaminase
MEDQMDSLFRFSALAEKMQPSPIRELFQVIQQPGMISFAGGLPDPDTFPVEAFASCANVLERDGRTVLQYGASEGYPPLRDAIAGMMESRLGYRPHHLRLTTGRGPHRPRPPRHRRRCGVGGTHLSGHPPLPA